MQCKGRCAFHIHCWRLHCGKSFQVFIGNKMFCVKYGPSRMFFLKQIHPHTFGVLTKMKNKNMKKWVICQSKLDCTLLFYFPHQHTFRVMTNLKNKHGYINQNWVICPIIIGSWSSVFSSILQIAGQLQDTFIIGIYFLQ